MYLLPDLPQFYLLPPSITSSISCLLGFSASETPRCTPVRRFVRNTLYRSSPVGATFRHLLLLEADGKNTCSFLQTRYRYILIRGRRKLHMTKRFKVPDRPHSLWGFPTDVTHYTNSYLHSVYCLSRGKILSFSSASQPYHTFSGHAIINRCFAFSKSDASSEPPSTSVPSQSSDLTLSNSKLRSMRLLSQHIFSSTLITPHQFVLSCPGPRRLIILKGLVQSTTFLLSHLVQPLQFAFQVMLLSTCRRPLT